MRLIKYCVLHFPFMRMNTRTRVFEYMLCISRLIFFPHISLKPNDFKLSFNTNEQSFFFLGVNRRFWFMFVYLHLSEGLQTKKKVRISFAIGICCAEPHVSFGEKSLHSSHTAFAPRYSLNSTPTLHLPFNMTILYDDLMMYETSLDAYIITNLIHFLFNSHEKHTMEIITISFRS